MKFKSVLILLLLLVLSLSIGVVSANDNVDLNKNLDNNQDITTNVIENIEINKNIDENQAINTNNNPNTNLNNNANLNNNTNTNNSLIKTKTVYVKTSDVIKAAISLKSFVKKNKALPVDIKVGTIEVSTPQFTYLMTVAIKNIKNKKLSSKIKVIDVKVKNPYSKYVYKKIKKIPYLKGANNVNKFIKTNKRVPNYVKMNNKKIGYEAYTYGFAKILAFYKSHKRLPNYCIFTSKVFKKAKATKIYSNNLNIYIGNNDYLTATLKNSEGKVLANKKLSLKYNNKNYIAKTNNKGVAKWKLSFDKGGNYTAEIKFAGDSKCLASKKSNKITVYSSVRFNDVIKSSVDLKNYVSANHTLPDKVIIGQYKLTTADFSYLMACALNNINKGDTVSNLYIHKVKVNDEVGDIIKFNVYKDNYLNLAEEVINSGDSNNALPATLKVYDKDKGDTTGKDANFDLYTYSFAVLLNFYNNNNRLPNYCQFNSYNFDNYISLNDVVIASSNLKSFIETNYYLPGHFNVGKYDLSIQQIAYLMTVTIKNINLGNTSDILIKQASSGAGEGDKLNNNVSLSIYNELAINISKQCDEKNTLPSTVTIDDKNADFKSYVLGFATVLDSYKQNKKLPETSLFNNKIYENYPMYKTINEENTEDNLTKYIESIDKWCNITPELQNIANELTKKSSSDLELAINIFNFVNDNTDYEFYYNSKKGAQETLTSGSGNCCDLSHLLIAIFRASNLPARYCHGTCTFISGSVTGHVWVQVCVDNMWYVCDASNYLNTFGHINSWHIDCTNFDDYYVLLNF